jgi:hypothetical protein
MLNEVFKRTQYEFTEHKGPSDLREINWTLCWKAWLNIGNQKSNYIKNTSEVVSHSQVKKLRKGLLGDWKVKKKL